MSEPKKKSPSLGEVPRPIRAQQAIEMMKEANTPITVKEAASLIDLKASTLCHHPKGRPLKEEISVDRQKLTPEEERAVIKQCEDLVNWWFPPEVWSFRDIAIFIANKRDPRIMLGEKWFRLFKKRYKELCTMYVDQLDYIRAVRGDDLKIIYSWFDKPEVCIKSKLLI